MPQPTNDNKPLYTQRRRRNAAPPKEPADRYPDENRSFAPDAPPGGHLGAGGDPSEGKRTD